VNIPTGKDSLETKKYPTEEVIAPGTVIISAAGNCIDIQKWLNQYSKETVAQSITSSIFTKIFKLVGHHFAQTLNTIVRHLQ
jgi:phosphoribosylformylglycinamidine synthase